MFRLSSRTSFGNNFFRLWDACTVIGMRANPFLREKWRTKPICCKRSISKNTLDKF